MKHSARADQQVSLHSCLGRVTHENKNQSKQSTHSTINTNQLKGNLIIAVFTTADLPLTPPAPIRVTGRWELLQPLYLCVPQPGWQKWGWRQTHLPPPFPSLPAFFTILK